MIKTNAVDSFVDDNLYSGNGECKLYLPKKGKETDSKYRNFFDINSELYGVTNTVYNGQPRTRDNGPENNCYFDKDKMREYIVEQLKNPRLLDFERVKLEEFNFDLMDDTNWFGVNYVYDSQKRPYIGGLGKNFSFLRYLAVSRLTIVNINYNTEVGGIEFWLTPGQL